MGWGQGLGPSAPREGVDRQEVWVMSQLSAAMRWFSSISQVREHRIQALPLSRLYLCIILTQYIHEICFNYTVWGTAWQPLIS